ncbi:MAG: hypothetical protein VX733_02130 [Candidatus Latescibacterota bacterium]|nr:hypothetical protein [Candidatus Latescibacterota bacterium]
MDAQFRLEEEQLAFLPGKENGFLVDTIFVDVDPAVVDFLTQMRDPIESWADLPSTTHSP